MSGSYPRRAVVIKQYVLYGFVLHGQFLPMITASLIIVLINNESCLIQHSFGLNQLIQLSRGHLCVLAWHH